MHAPRAERFGNDGNEELGAVVRTIVYAISAVGEIESGSAAKAQKRGTLSNIRLEVGWGNVGMTKDKYNKPNDNLGEI